jgi:hypothetical protein
MTIRQLVATSASTLSLLALPCQAGPCSQDIERMQLRIDGKLNTLAAAGPVTVQSVGSQMHRQPTPGSIANAESKLGEVSSHTVEAIKDAMTRASKADIAGDKSACEKALADAQRTLGP